MEYDIIFVTGEHFFDHPLNGIAILKRVLEDKGYLVGVIENPVCEKDLITLGRPKLFFGVSSGSIDSMLRNYTPLKKKREDDDNSNYFISMPDRAVTVYCNWLKKNFKDCNIVIGGTESTLRRFAHYDYWENRIRKPILFDTKTKILVYGPGEKPIIEIAQRIKDNQDLFGILGTCVLSKTVPDDFQIIPSFEEVLDSKEKFVEMQNSFSNEKNLAQKTGDWFMLQFKSPNYSSQDLDYYYNFNYTRNVPKELRGFEFSVVTHRGCIGECNFCSLIYTQGNKIISRSEESILKEIEYITTLHNFKGNIDDLGGPSANMYGMDCSDCSNSCIGCKRLDKTHSRILNLLKKAKSIKGVKNIFIRSGIRYDIAPDEYMKEVIENHTFETLRIAPEHVDKNVLKAMNKNYGDLDNFIKKFNSFKTGKSLSYYFMTGHPGSSMKEAKILSDKIHSLKNAESVQIFTPTPMSVSTCMYHTGINPKTKEKLYIPYTYNEKKQQKNIIFD